MGIVALLLVAFVVLEVVSRNRLAAAHAEWADSGALSSVDALEVPEFPARAESLDEWLGAVRSARHAWSGPYLLTDETSIEEWFDRASADDSRRETLRALLDCTDEALGEEARALDRIDASLDRSLARGRVPEVGTPERALLDARAVVAREVAAVARRVGETGGASPRVDTDSREHLPAIYPAGVVEAHEVAADLPLSAVAPSSLERGIADLEAAVEAAGRLVGGPVLVECYSRGMVVELVSRHLPVLVQLATAAGDTEALDRIERALGAFAPLERLRAAARVQHLLAHEFFVARERSRSEAKRYATWIQEFDLVPGGWWMGREARTEWLLAAVHPVRVPSYRLEHAAFHRRWPELEGRVAREWWEPGSFAHWGEPEPSESASHAEHVLRKGLFGAYVWASRSQALLRAARCAVAYGRGGEAALVEALDAHRDPFTGDPFERDVGEDGIAELRSPGTPLLEGPITWPLPRR